MTRFEPIDPDEAIRRLINRIEPVEDESLSFDPNELAGRVLSRSVALDRDSPALDVSAMDGYAARLEELQTGPLPIVGEARIGQSPPALPERSVLRIYTGGPLPRGADTVVRLERATEDEGELRLKDDADLTAGADIRRRAENAQRGDTVIEAGVQLTPAAMTALASIGPREISLRRHLRVAVLTTGDELIDPAVSAEPPAWRLRDSNGPTLAAMLASAPWIDSVERDHAADDLAGTARQIAELTDRADAVVLTGGVSKGAHDYVPASVEKAGGEIVFHRLNARPGRPTLGGLIGGKPVLGLPGNPVAVLTAGRRVLVPVLRRLAGFAQPNPPTPEARLESWSGKPIPLTWWRPVRLIEPGLVKLGNATRLGRYLWSGDERWVY